MTERSTVPRGWAGILQGSGHRPAPPWLRCGTCESHGQGCVVGAPCQDEAGRHPEPRRIPAQALSPSPRAAAGRRLAAVLAGLSAWSCGAGPAEPPPAGAHLACEEPTADFGQVWEGAVLEHAFVFRSAGTEPVVVRGTRADCGCTVARLERETADGRSVPYEEGTPLEPGSRLVLRVTYDTTGKVGTGERQVKLFCNEPDGLAGATLRAEVRRRLVTEPDPPPAASMAVGGGTSVDFVVRSVEDEAFALVHEPRGLPSSISVDLEALEPPGAARAERWRVRLELGPGTPEGVHSYPVFLRTDLERDDRPEPGARIDFAPFVIARVLGRFSKEPASLSFGAMALDETVSRTVRIRCNDPEHELSTPAAEIVPLVAERSIAWAADARVQVRAVPEERAWDVEVVLEGLPPETERTFLGRLDVHTGHPEQPLVSVNLQGFRSDGGGSR